MQESLGHKLRLMRAQRGLSLREAARRAGMVKETISDIERGKTHPYDVTLAKLAQAYEVPIEELLEEPVLAGKAEAPEVGHPDESTEEEERREREIYAAVLMENLSERAKELEETYRSSVDTIPIPRHIAFHEAQDALTLLYEEMAARGTPSKKLQDAKKRLKEAASRLDVWYRQLAHPESPEMYETRRKLAIKRVKRDQELERNDNAARQSETGRERPAAG